MKKISYILIISMFFGCKDNNFRSKTTETTTLFTSINPLQSKIDFSNQVKQDDSFNCVRYTYALIGAGVAVGDVDNDGLEDIYFISNQNANKLYLNKGNFKFEDVTMPSKVADNQGWSTGVSMVDINNDGWLDMYVCKSASLNNDELRRNKLFINQKDGSFKEEAKRWGLDHNGFSIQSYFFDYDKDGDLDMYLVNHRPDFENTLRLEKKGTQKFQPETSDHLFRNDGDTFTNVTVQSKIINKAWGLSASIGDFNNDNWPDIYVANDYIAPDMLYINNRDGTFSNQINTRLPHISYNSMGSDFADINNDFLPDLIVLEMSAEDHVRSKENMPTMNTKGFKKIVDAGYHKPYMANVLQLNNGNGSFSDIGQLTGMSKTDWSWSPLIADFDNDGFKDLFVSNGIERNFSNQDYALKVKKNLDKGIEMTVQEVIEMMPSDKLANYSYRNSHDLSFENTSVKWGFEKKINSNGVACGDFDNDGDLDLVMNNLSDTASVYKNNSVGNYLNIKLIGTNRNKMAVGAKVKVFANGGQQYQELYPSRGYLSSVSKMLNFGFGDIQTIDRLEVIWDSGEVSVLENFTVNQTLTISYTDGNFEKPLKNEVARNLIPVNIKSLGIDYSHKEEIFDDFSKQVLLPQKLSQQGPTLSVADINGDGQQDFFIGGSKNWPAQVFLQKNKRFERVNQPIIESDAKSEDVDSHFFDADNDGDLDLYVVSGSYEFSQNNPFLSDRLYQNDGKGNFNKKIALPKNLTNTKVVKSSDFDNDGDLDLFIGGHSVSGKYPLAYESYVLINNGGSFKEATQSIATEFSEIGIVNDILFSDYDSDGDEDMFVVGEWIPITLFTNTNGEFVKTKIDAFQHTNGWWNTIKTIDLDGDGDEDYIVGNLGKNNKFQPSVEKPLHIYGNDFDGDNSYDMVLSKSYKGKLVPIRGKECSTQQNSFIKSKLGTFEAFANSSLAEIYGEGPLKSAYHKEVYQFSSVYIINKGNGDFEIQQLPNEAQTGPTLDFEIVDVNKDGIDDVIGIGAIHETEVETIPYNSNTGYILLGTKEGGLLSEKDINFYNNQNAKHIEKILIGTNMYFLIANNNAPLTIFKEK